MWVRSTVKHFVLKTQNQTKQCIRLFLCLISCTAAVGVVLVCTIGPMCVITCYSVPGTERLERMSGLTATACSSFLALCLIHVIKEGYVWCFTPLHTKLHPLYRYARGIGNSSNATYNRWVRRRQLLWRQINAVYFKVPLCRKTLAGRWCGKGFGRNSSILVWGVEICLNHSHVFSGTEWVEGLDYAGLKP